MLWWWFFFTIQSACVLGKRICPALISSRVAFTFLNTFLYAEIVPNLTVEVTAIDSEFTQQERLYFILIWFNQYLPKVIQVNAFNIVVSAEKNTANERQGFLTFKGYDLMDI